MRAAPALIKDFSQRKLSPSSLPGFDPQRLVTELLSLGNPKLTGEIALTVSREVEAELKKRAVPLSAELVSQIVQFKLQELGFLEFRRLRKKTRAVLEEETVVLPETTQELPITPSPRFNLHSVKVQLPTLEKFLTPTPAPPRAELRVPQNALAHLQDLGIVSQEAPLKNLEALFWEIAQAAAKVEGGYPSPRPVDTLAVEFFNAMANQEIYPHLPSLMGSDSQLADGAALILLPFTAAHHDWGKVLQEAKEVWQQGRAVVFGLEGADLTLEDFEKLLGAMERAILDLPEQVEIPRWIGLQLFAENPQALDFLRTALSGRYYPRFSFHLGVSDALVEEFIREGESVSQSSSLRKILQENWKKSEPSLVFLSRHKGQEMLRPGGGPSLKPYEGCVLGSLNLSIIASGHDVDWRKLRRMVRSALHFLENLLDVTPYPSERIARQTLRERKLGLGVMGFAELLAKLAIPYDSEASLALAEKLMRFISEEAAQASQNLAEKRGAFPDAPGLSDAALPRRRHASLTSVVNAPVLASLAGVTPGVDPALAEQEQGMVSEISLEWQLKIQGAFQSRSDGSVGKFLSIPETDSLEILHQVLKTAQWVGLHQLKLSQNPALDLTVETPRRGVSQACDFSEPAETGDLSATPEIHPSTQQPVHPRPRPEVMNASTRLIQTGYGPLSVTLARDALGPYELKAQMGKAGSRESAEAEALSRLTSLLMSTGVEMRLIHEELKGIRAPRTAIDHGEEVLSCADAIAKVLNRELSLEEKEEVTEVPASFFAEEEATVVTHH